MAIFVTEDFEGAPTSGQVNADNHDLIGQPANEATNNATLVQYRTGYTAGHSSVGFVGTNWCWLHYMFPTSGSAQHHLRFRAYIRRDTTDPTGHVFLFVPRTGTANESGSNVGSSYDVQIRNTTGYPIWNRYNFVNAGATSAFPQETWWRIEWEMVNESAGNVTTGDGTGRTTGGVLCEVWYDPDSDGAPDYSTWTAGVGDGNKLVFGNAGNAVGGAETWYAHLAVSEGERIGPFEAAATQLDTPNVTVDAKSDPTTVGGTDGTADISWAAVTNATSYRIERASSLNATTGFTTLVESHGTTSYQATGLTDGDYTLAVTAKP